MEDIFEISWSSFYAIVLSSVGIYFSVILFTRICGKRSFSKMSSFDFAMTVAVGSIIATTVLSATVSLWEGVIGLACVYTLQISLAFARRNKVVKNAIDNTPLLLMIGNEVLEKNLRKARVAKSDLRAKLREANVYKHNQIKAVIFETTGDISVIHADNNEKIETWLLEDVLME